MIAPLEHIGDELNLEQLKILKIDLEKREQDVRTKLKIYELEKNIHIHEKLQFISNFESLNESNRNWQRLKQFCMDIANTIETSRVVIYDDDPMDQIKKEIKHGKPHILPGELGFRDYKLHRGLPVMIGSRQGIGKSTMALNLALIFAYKQKTTVIYSLEMTVGQVWTKLLCIHTKKIQMIDITFDEAYDDITNDDPDSYYKVMFREFKNQYKEYIIVVDVFGCPTSYIVGSYDHIKNKFNKEIDFAIIDYIQIVPSERHLINKPKREQEIYKSQLLKDKSKLTGTNYIIVSQMNIDGGFRESSAYLDDCGMAIILEREKDKKTEEYKDTLDIKIIKNRFGPCGKRNIYFDPRSGLIG